MAKKKKFYKKPKNIWIIILIIIGLIAIFLIAGNSIKVPYTETLEYVVKEPYQSCAEKEYDSEFIMLDCLPTEECEPESKTAMISFYPSTYRITNFENKSGNFEVICKVYLEEELEYTIFKNYTCYKFLIKPHSHKDFAPEKTLLLTEREEIEYPIENLFYSFEVKKPSYEHCELEYRNVTKERIEIRHRTLFEEWGLTYIHQ